MTQRSSELRARVAAWSRVRERSTRVTATRSVVYRACRERARRMCTIQSRTCSCLWRALPRCESVVAGATRRGAAICVSNCAACVGPDIVRFVGRYTRRGFRSLRPHQLCVRRCLSHCAPTGTSATRVCGRCRRPSREGGVSRILRLAQLACGRVLVQLCPHECQSRGDQVAVRLASDRDP